MLLARRAVFTVAAAGVIAPPGMPAAASSLCSDSPQRIVDSAGFLDDAQRSRLDRILLKLEEDTGFALRVLSRSRTRRGDDDDDESWYTLKPTAILRCGFGLSGSGQNAMLIVADRGIAGALDAGSSFLTFPFVGDQANFALPDVFWKRLQREYGRKAFIDSRGEAASVIVACEQIITCLRSEEQFCTDVPPASASFF